MTVATATSLSGAGGVGDGLAAKAHKSQIVLSCHLEGLAMVA